MRPSLNSAVRLIRSASASGRSSPSRSRSRARRSRTSYRHIANSPPHKALLPCLARAGALQSPILRAATRESEFSLPPLRPSYIAAASARSLVSRSSLVLDHGHLHTQLTADSKVHVSNPVPVGKRWGVGVGDWGWGDGGRTAGPGRARRAHRHRGTTRPPPRWRCPGPRVPRAWRRRIILNLGFPRHKVKISMQFM